MALRPRPVTALRERGAGGWGTEQAAAATVTALPPSPSLSIPFSPSLLPSLLTISTPLPPFLPLEPEPRSHLEVGSPCTGMHFGKSGNQSKILRASSLGKLSQGFRVCQPCCRACPCRLGHPDQNNHYSHPTKPKARPEKQRLATEVEATPPKRRLPPPSVTAPVSRAR